MRSSTCWTFPAWRRLSKLWDIRLWSAQVKRKTILRNIGGSLWIWWFLIWKIRGVVCSRLPVPIMYMQLIRDFIRRPIKWYQGEMGWQYRKHCMNLYSTGSKWYRQTLHPGLRIVRVRIDYVEWTMYQSNYSILSKHFMVVPLHKLWFDTCHRNKNNELQIIKSFMFLDLSYLKCSDSAALIADNSKAKYNKR